MFLGVKDTLYCIKQFHLNFGAFLPLEIKVGFGAKLLPDLTGVLKLPSENPLNFDVKILSVPQNFWKYFKTD